MFDKRLFSLVPGIGRLIAAKVASLWISLLAEVMFAYVLAATLTDIVQSVILLAQGYQVAVSYTNIAALAFALLVVCVVKYLTARAGATFGTEAAERVKVALREKLYRKMLALGPSYSSHVRTSDIVQSAGEGIDQIQSFFELFVPQLFYAVLAPITLFVVLAPFNIPAAVTLLVCAPLIVLIVGAVAMSAARVFKKYWGRYTDMGAAFLDNMQGLETLKTFDADEQAAREMDKQSEQFREMTMKVLQIQLRSLTAMDVVAYGGTAAGIGVAIWQFSSGAIAFDGVLLVVLLSASFFLPLRQLGSYFHVAMNGMTSTKRIFALLDVPEAKSGTVSFPADTQNVSVTFSHVGYSYMQADDVMNSDTPQGASNNSAGVSANRPASNTGGFVNGSVNRTAAYTAGNVINNTVSSTASNTGNNAVTSTQALRDVSFTAYPGRLTAIVGESGSGKSTAAALMAGSLAGYEGSICFAGTTSSTASPDISGEETSPSSFTVESHDLSTSSLVSAIGLVSSRSHLFAGTLRSNLLMGSARATDDELWQALERAHIADFVRSHVDGLDMPIEQGAANLSGGQRQRFAIARALLRHCLVYVFDEATSSVDAESEAFILDTIHSLAQQATVIMITHRMANAEDADQVVVFDHGQVVECGDHHSLMADNGTYARLYRTQQAVEHVSRRDSASSYNGVPIPSVTASVSAHVTVDTPDITSNDSAPADTDRATSTGNSAFDNNGLYNTNTSDNEKAQSNTGSNAPHTSPKKPVSTSALIRRLLHEVGPLRRYMVIACVCGIIGHLAATFLPVFGVFALFAMLGSPLWGMGVGVSVAAMIVCALVRGGLRYAEQYMNHNVAFRLLALFRSRAFAAMRRLAPAKLAGKGKGDLIALITTDVELLEIFFAHTISPVVIAVTTTVVYAIALLKLSAWFALLLVISHLLVGVLLPRLFAGSVRDLGARLREKSSALDDVMLDDMRGLDEIIRFSIGDSRVADIVNRSKALWNERMELSARNGRFSGLGSVLVVLCSVFAVVIAATIVLFTFTPINAGTLVASVVLIVSSFGPTLALSALPANLTQTFASARRLFALIDETPAVEENGTQTPAYTGMTMESVTFAYPDATQSAHSTDNGHTVTTANTGNTVNADRVADTNMVNNTCSVPKTVAAARPVLKEMSLNVPAHGILGIQGPSGRGKSTILKLLMHYWEPTSGRVAMSGDDIRNVNAHHRRRVQTMLSQETYLFDGTICSNLQLAKPDASDDEMREALSKASALDLIDSLPDGLNTNVGELGGRLSEGERQRIGLARIFLRDADLVLLDEPTSRLDAFNEAVILQSVNALANNRDTAILLVSHRDSTMRIADTVITM